MRNDVRCAGNVASQLAEALGVEPVHARDLLRRRLQAGAPRSGAAPGRVDQRVLLGDTGRAVGPGTGAIRDLRVVTPGCPRPRVGPGDRDVSLLELPASPTVADVRRAFEERAWECAPTPTVTVTRAVVVSQLDVAVIVIGAASLGLPVRVDDRTVGGRYLADDVVAALLERGSAEEEVPDIARRVRDATTLRRAALLHHGASPASERLGIDVLCHVRTAAEAHTLAADIGSQSRVRGDVLVCGPAADALAARLRDTGGPDVRTIGDVGPGALVSDVTSADVVAVMDATVRYRPTHLDGVAAALAHLGRDPVHLTHEEIVIDSLRLRVAAPSTVPAPTATMAASSGLLSARQVPFGEPASTWAGLVETSSVYDVRTSTAWVGPASVREVIDAMGVQVPAPDPEAP